MDSLFDELEELVSDHRDNVKELLVALEDNEPDKIKMTRSKLTTIADYLKELALFIRKSTIFTRKDKNFLCTSLWKKLREVLYEILNPLSFIENFITNMENPSPRTAVHCFKVTCKPLIQTLLLSFNNAVSNHINIKDIEPLKLQYTFGIVKSDEIVNMFHYGKYRSDREQKVLRHYNKNTVDTLLQILAKYKEVNIPKNQVLAIVTILIDRKIIDENQGHDFYNNLFTN
jgi:hypothetical protein